MDSTRKRELEAKAKAEAELLRTREEAARRERRGRADQRRAELQAHDETWRREMAAHTEHARSVARALREHIGWHWRPSSDAFARYPEGLLRIPERFVAVHVDRVVLPLLVRCVEVELEGAYARTAFRDEFLSEGRYARRVDLLPVAPPALQLLDRLSSATCKTFDEALCAAATHLYQAGVVAPFQNPELWRIPDSGTLRVTVEKRATAEGWELSGARRKTGPEARKEGNRVMRRRGATADGGISRRAVSRVVCVFPKEAADAGGAPPTPTTPRPPCTRCGLDRIPDDAEQCPDCGWPLDETWDEHETYHWQDGNDLRCCACGELWSAKVQHCLGDCCGGPVEPVDGSWHVEWVSGGALHSEMPVFFNGRYREADVEEEAKRSAKAAACAANNYDFMTWAASTRGGIGREAAEWFTTGFAAKVALARSDGEKWRVRNERKRLLQQHSAIIARRNWEITQRNAWPRMGGVAPRAPPVE
ncbi:hypothetical protein EMIHUDRAFT_205414 [Emiliania huxleyi CCMP1516]|uniref:C2H2-type domain-containing protein n=2 Tax=Emiliania huxleyi TaxID=2903 RepID=A0A0D3JSB0_EMIH1|nr:hypothetical protein EMIHUDRAFT_205414 [Emiliania huxleyi CCMP1516]EOD26395.1 hypothetical protein EMIHUDRAFT_205414 [Emiliania huxleyi CCMP1516]|eukprot:XP_005778824.1 hypothetical protein EMIHUDRAFT_205414 [Emiliania huxleyi CCMP1516]